MGGDKRKISSGSEISFSELKQLAEDGDAIAQNKLAFFEMMQPDNRSEYITVKGCDELGMDGTMGTTR